MQVLSYTTATELQRNYKMVATRAKKTGKPVIVLSNSKPDGVYLDYKVFESKYEIKDIKLNENSRDFFKFSGLWTNEEADEFDKNIEEAFEQVNSEDWK